MVAGHLHDQLRQPMSVNLGMHYTIDSNVATVRHQRWLARQDIATVRQSERAPRRQSRCSFENDHTLVGHRNSDDVSHREQLTVDHSITVHLKAPDRTPVRRTNDGLIVIE